MALYEMMDLSKVKVKENIRWAEVLGTLHALCDQLVEYDPETGLYMNHDEMEHETLLYVLLQEYTDMDLSALDAEDGKIDLFRLHGALDGIDEESNLYKLYMDAYVTLSGLIYERQRQYDAALSVGAQIKRIADRLSKLDGKDVGVLRRLLTEAVIKTQKEQKPEAAGNTPIVDMGAFKAKKKDKQD